MHLEEVKLAAVVAFAQATICTTLGEVNEKNAIRLQEPHSLHNLVKSAIAPLVDEHSPGNPTQLGFIGEVNTAYQVNVAKVQTAAKNPSSHIYAATLEQIEKITLDLLSPQYYNSKVMRKPHHGLNDSPDTFTKPSLSL